MNVDLDESNSTTWNITHFETLNQATSWICNGTDMVAKFRDFQASDGWLFSLSRDDITDVTCGSSFSKYLPEHVFPIAREVAPVPNIYSKWPTLQALSDRVFGYSTYEDVAKAIRKEDMEDPIAFYLISIVAS